MGKSVSQFLNELWGTFFVDKHLKEVASGRFCRYGVGLRGEFLISPRSVIRIENTQKVEETTMELREVSLYKMRKCYRETISWKSFYREKIRLPVPKVC